MILILFSLSFISFAKCYLQIAPNQFDPQSFPLELPSFPIDQPSFPSNLQPFPIDSQLVPIRRHLPPIPTGGRPISLPISSLLSLINPQSKPKPQPEPLPFPISSLLSIMNPMPKPNPRPQPLPFPISSLLSLINPRPKPQPLPFPIGSILSPFNHPLRPPPIGVDGFTMELLMFPLPCKPQPPAPTVKPPMPECRTLKGTKCTFPFVYKNKTFLQCTEEGWEKPWCATETGPDGEFVDGAWGECDNECPAVQTECEFTPDCLKYDDCKNIADASCVCVKGNCTIQGAPWQLPGGVNTECVGDIITKCPKECQADRSKCFCIFGSCITREYECHNTKECENLYKCKGDVKCQCQNGVCEKDDTENVESEEAVDNTLETETEKPVKEDSKWVERPEKVTNSVENKGKNTVEEGSKVVDKQEYEEAMTVKPESNWVDRQEMAPTTVKIKETTTAKVNSNWAERPQKPVLQGNKY